MNASRGSGATSSVIHTSSTRVCATPAAPGEVVIAEHERLLARGGRYAIEPQGV